MKWIMIFLFQWSLFTSLLYGEAAPPHLQEIGGMAYDTALLAEVKDITFFPYVFAPSKQAAVSMQKLWIQELKKWGKVVIKPSSVEHLAEDKRLLHACSLVYQIQDMTNLAGTPLPMTQVTLTFSRSVLIESNKAYGSAVLWGQECFIPKTQDMAKAVTETLPPLLQALQKALKSSSKELTFYVIDNN